MGSYVQRPKLPLLLSDNSERKYEVTLAVERVCRDRRTKTSPKIWVELRSWNELTELDCESSGRDLDSFNASDSVEIFP
jgi:hypothetical protein